MPESKKKVKEEKTEKKKAKPKVKKETAKKSKTKKEEPIELVETGEDLGEATEAPTRLEAEGEEKDEAASVEVEAAQVKGAEKEAEEEKTLKAEPETPVVEAPVEAEEPEEEEEEGLEIVEEKYYDLNLRRIWNTPRKKRTPRAVRYVREFVAKRMKSDEVSISEETNSLLWARGISKPPRHLRLRVVKDKDDRVIVFPGETTTGAEPGKAEVEAEAS